MNASALGRFAWILAAMTAGASGAQIAANTSIRAPADIGLSEEILGMGYWNEFQDADPNGKAARVYPLKTKTTEDSRYEVDFFQVDNSLLLSANARYLSASLSAATDEKRRFMVLRVVRISKVVSLESAEDRLAFAPMYAARIIYGWSYSVVFEGDSTTFSTALAAKLLALGGEIAETTKTSGIRYSVRAIGLKPRAGRSAIPTTTNASELAEMFEVEDGSKPQPILVEYRTTQPLDVRPVEWKAPEFASGDYVLKEVSLSVLPSKPSGAPWDALAGRPDPKFFLMVDGQASGPYCLKQDSFSLVCAPNKTIRLSPDSVVSLNVVDQDLSADDPIGSAVLRRPLASEEPDSRITLRTSGQVQEASIVLGLSK